MAEKLTNFQRMKARQFEEEGYGGRSMTRSAAKKKALEKVGDFFGIKVSVVKKTKGNLPIGMTSKKVVFKPLTSAFAKKNLAANQAIGKKK